MLYAKPNTDGAIIHFKKKYLNYIGGEWVSPVKEQYFSNTSPVDNREFCQVPASTKEDVDLAVDVAHKALATWSKTSVTERSNLLLKIADRIEANSEMLAVAETWDNGKPVRETLAADLPLVVDHFRYFAGCIRAQEGTAAELDNQTTTYHFPEPIGVVGQIIPWNFPLLMAAWKLAPALASGCCVVLKPAEQTPASILVMMELLDDLLPAGVINVVNGFGADAGQALATHKRIAKIAFTGSTEVGQQVLKCAADNLIPSTVELGGKSPNIFMADIFDHEDSYVDKCVEGVLLAFFNQGEVCTCPSRLLIQESIYDRFMAKLLERMKTIVQGNPLDTDTQVGSQVSQEQFNKIRRYIQLGLDEGAELLVGGNSHEENGYFIEPTLLKGSNEMRIFQEEIFGPVVAVTTFKTVDEALEIANATEYGLGAGIWTRDNNTAYHMARQIEAGRVWVNCYHAYPAHAAFGGYKKSGIGRETHKMMLGHYQNTKNMIVSYSVNPLGFF
ncbi:aldehyde dehydrogenase [Vibrio europaeus]|uniref:aldehyde dehydrogenase family protein n=1 Tax=Vibrio europaeus TaxID=300876 RepID=UPI00233F2C09|nr:aldehyde dehydrogenase family protein [Vibrio europaeus]MDC5721874.1 aldehyde dehydrogenase [Vibrio europaeus]MDC5758261.1 aldehyde dehydrogenase [Vibrio europaeus]MDC5776538.1 aldehyde dehydrogenase [Vibrio europaeus]MDC5795603.1 aldehyde dehydrogenase [Vibrio europaeus]MDC5801546.1 aldehyde dehydrogenase [Vibrio europaeus]